VTIHLSGQNNSSFLHKDSANEEMCKVAGKVNGMGLDGKDEVDDKASEELAAGLVFQWDFLQYPFGESGLRLVLIRS
jgi:hypothetical protein